MKKPDKKERLLITDGLPRPKFKIPPGCKTLLIGEGGNDARFLAAFARHLGDGAAWGFGIGGKGNLKNELSVVADVMDGPSAEHPDPRRAFLRLRAFAVVLDANGGRAEAEDKINEALAESKFELVKVDRIGHGKVERVKFHNCEMLAGAFVMPGGERDGYLEDLVLQAAEETHGPVMERVGDFRARVRKINGGPEKPQDESKKKAQALLSALRKNHVYVGTAAQQAAKDAEEGKVPEIDFKAAAFEELQDFLRKLAAA